MIDNSEVRCQLLLDHEGRHAAVALAPNVSRHLWQWSGLADEDQVTRRPFQAELADALAWAPGMPAPADASA